MKNRKIYFYWVFLFFIFSLILSFFYRVNQENYKKISQIKENRVKHPENLPTKKMARLTTF
jgi:Na+/melibiose symporter-like transporter